MSSALYFQIVIPLVLGLAFSVLRRPFAGVVTARRASSFAAQVVLIYLCGFASAAGLLITVLLLLGYISFAQAKESHQPTYRSLSLVFFSGYLGYWLIEKYLLPLGLDAWLLEHVSSLAPDAGVLAVTMVGLSYIGVKLIHFFVDSRAGKISNVDPLEFLSWLLFFPAIVAGPMQRFQDWQAQRAEVSFTLGDLVAGLQRLLTGMLMKFGMADTLHSATIAEMSPGTLATATFWQLAGSAACYSVYLYWDFAGYSHMAIGLGRFWGVTLPENFNWPFLARNLAEFWNRWHITLSLILRDYIFYPLSLHLKRLPFSRRHQNIAATIPPIVTFVLAGVWHGATIGFILWGFTHGLGLAFLAVLKRRKRPNTALAQWWRTSPVGYSASALLTFAYVTLSLVFFALSGDELLILWQRLTY